MITRQIANSLFGNYIANPIQTAEILIARWRFDYAFKRHCTHRSAQTAHNLWEPAWKLHALEPFAGVSTIGDFEDFYESLCKFDNVIDTP